MEQEELAPCPFCGGEAVFYGSDCSWNGKPPIGHWQVRCSREQKGCWFEIRIRCGGANTKQEAINAWNKRSGE